MKSSKEEVQNRRDKVLDYIVSKETTSIDELSMYFSVSSITIRRDIEELRNNDMVDMRNGIVTINPRYKRHLKDNHHAAERRQIQMKAAKFIEDGDVIFINTSYTALGILEYIEDIYQKVHIYFGIPYEAGEGRELRFKLGEFCKHFSLQHSQAYYAIRYLDRIGQWTLTEDLDIKTRIAFSVDRRALYDVEFPERKMIEVLEVLMRCYEGIFSYPVPIDEDYVSSRCGLTVPGLRSLLYQISLLHIIRYIPAECSDVIFLRHGRLAPGNIRLEEKTYGLLRANYHSRSSAMKEYVSEDDECRQKFLLRYFGQEDSAPCGTCDVCRAAAKSPAAAELIKDFIQRKGGVYTLDDLRDAFSVPGPSEIAGWPEILRTLIDDGDVPAPAL